MPKSSKSKTIYVCSNCGNEFSRWEGQCKACGEWNTLFEAPSHSVASTSVTRRASTSKPKKLSEIDLSESKRISTNIDELDRTLGGGLVAGQVVLISGNPGIGKSTLLMQIANTLAAKGQKILYASGEEADTQVAMRAKRLDEKATENENLEIVSSNSIDQILDSFEHDLLIVDSIQTVATEAVETSAGSIGQIRECTFRIVAATKESGKPAIIVGHITKEGSIAGPKMLEHMVDTVLYLEGDKSHLFRLLRVQKNRFGDDSEVGIFEMTSSGLMGVKNPSEKLLQERANNLPGSAVAIVLEGSRPIAVEIQALTTKTSFGYPKRASSGYSLTRLQLICAVIQKRTGVNLLDQDVYVNVAAGVQVRDPGADLAVCAAILSSIKNTAIPKTSVFFGEVGLSGEVREVVANDRRQKEAKNLGFTEIRSAKSVKNIANIAKF